MYKLHQFKFYYLIVANVSQKHINANAHQIKKVKTIIPNGITPTFTGDCLPFVVAIIVKSIIFAKNKKLFKFISPSFL